MLYWFSPSFFCLYIFIVSAHLHLINVAYRPRNVMFLSRYFLCPNVLRNLSLTDRIFGHRVDPPAGVNENTFKSGDVDSENGGLSLFNVKKRQTADHQLKNNDHHHVK